MWLFVLLYFYTLKALYTLLSSSKKLLTSIRLVIIFMKRIFTFDTDACKCGNVSNLIKANVPFMPVLLTLIKALLVNYDTNYRWLHSNVGAVTGKYKIVFLTNWRWISEVCIQVDTSSLLSHNQINYTCSLWDMSYYQ